MSDAALNQPTLRKWMPICQAVGDFQNGDQEGDLSVGYLKAMVANLKKYPRQVPVYLATGTGADHPEGLDDRMADGWVENLEMRGDWLYGDVKTHGQAAIAIANDMVRGASIGSVQGKTYAGSPIGPVLEHLLITNQPFVKGMNIAASRAKGGEPIAYHFTALKPEAEMADKKQPGVEKAPETVDQEPLNLTARMTELEVQLTEKDGVIRELQASNANLLKEVEAFRNSPQLTIALKELDQQKRINKANKVRFITARMSSDRQISMDALRGWYDHDSDEVVLAGFQNSQFKGDLNLLQYHRDSVTKNPTRSYASGEPLDGGELNAQDRKAAVEAGKDPDVLAQTAGASNYTEWKKRRKAAGKE